MFGLLAARGGVPPEEMERVFNMGVGMVAVVGRADADRALGVLSSRGVPAWALGEVVPGTGNARLTGPAHALSPRASIRWPGRPG